MKKYRVLLALIVVLMSAIFCASLVACGDGDGGGGGSSEKVVITYYIREDSAPLTVKAKKYEEFKFALHSLKRAHYTFGGMYEGPNGSGNMIVDETGKSTALFVEDTTLYCFWLPLTYTLEFDAGEGSMNDNEKTKSIQYGSSVGLLPTPTLEGYDFDGWFIGETRISTGAVADTGKNTFIDSEYVIPDQGNVVLTARYKIKEYTVTFNYYDGRVDTTTIKVEHGQEIPVEAFPEEDTGSRVLYAWSTSTNTVVKFTGVVTENVTLYAFWKNYKLLKFYDGVDPVAKEQKLFESETFTPEELTNRNGYTFRGWYDNKNTVGSEYTIIKYNTACTDFYAKWTTKQYNLTFDANGGSCYLTFTTYNIETETFELPEAQKTNFTFLGWCVNSDLSDTPITELAQGTYDVTVLYAKYKGEDKTLILDAGEGTLDEDRKVVEYGAKFTAPVPSLSGYVFVGWYDGEDSSANKITGSDGVSLQALNVSDSEITLYAHYMEKLYITTSVNISKAGSTSVKEYYLEGEEVTLKATLNSGYKFLGWYEYNELVCEELNYKFTMGANWRTLELKYEPKKYTVTLYVDVNNGESCEESSVEVTFGEYYTLPVPTRPGYTFLGWSHNETVITEITGVSLQKWSKTSNITVKAKFVIEDPDSILVHDARTLTAISQNPSGKYSLVSNIDMTGVSWTPFDFSGTFKGNGLVISNLTVTSSSGALGIFKKFTGNMSNVTFENLTIESTSYDSVFVGGICAEMAGGTLDGVTVKGSVTGDFCRIGGFAGKVTGGTITNCKNYAVVSSDTYESAISAGGITGYFTGGDINNCENYGTISIKQHVGGLIGYSSCEKMSYLTNNGTVTGKNNVGGIVGFLEKAGSYNLIVDFVNNGTVTGEDCVAGGIAKLTNAWNAGDTSATYNLKINKITNNGTINGIKHVAGVVGYLYGNVDGRYSSNNPSLNIAMDDLKNTGDITGGTYVGGIIGFGQTDNGGSTLSRSSSSGTIEAEAIIGGLVGQVSTICIKDCQNTDVIVKATGYYTSGTTYYAYVGGYAGIAYYIEGCNNAEDITYDNIGIFVGGIAGEIRSYIKNSTNSGDIKALKSAYVGGVAGHLTNAGAYDVMNITNTGDVTGKNYTGGIFGKLNDDFNAGDTSTTYNVKISKITNSGKIIGESRTGGCIGYIYGNSSGRYSSNNPTVMFTCTEWKNTGDVTGTTYVGGLVGYIYSDNGGSQIAQSSSTADITAEAYVGGLAGRLENVKLISSTNQNSTVTATGFVLDGTTYYGYVGAYVGWGYYIEDCHNEVVINYTSIGNYVGGIAGRISSTIVSSTNKASVTASSSNYVGGLIGSITATGSYTSKENNNSGAVNGKNRVGGLYGEIYNDFNAGDTSATYDVNLSKLTNTGNVTGVTEVGGLFGYVYLNVSGRYNSNNPSARIVANDWNSSGAVVATATENAVLGAFVGKISTDNSGSALTIYTCTGTVNGAIATESTLIGSKSNFKINTI